jgi:hypothetical protein
MPDFDTIDDVQQGTAGSDVDTGPDLPTVTEAPAWAEITDEVGYLHNQAQILRDDTDELHIKSLIQEWQAKSSDLVREDMGTILGQLASFGFAWRDVARMIGVSVPAVQKWRRGGAPTGESRFSAAAALAACEIITQHYLVKDIATWFEAPFYYGAPVTPLDLYEARRIPLVFVMATGHGDPEKVLSAFDPDWRETYRSEFEIFEADDGFGLRKRDT